MKTMTTSKTKRLSVAGDKLIGLKSNSALTNLNNWEDEINYLNKVEVSESNIKRLIEYSKERRKSENDSLRNEYMQLVNSLQISNKENIELRNKLSEMDKQYDELCNEYNKCNELKQKLNNDIIKLRKDTLKDMEGKLNTLAKQDKTIKHLKKELFLILNLLKLRVINTDSVDQDNCIKSYMIDIHRNKLKYLELKRNENEKIKLNSFWNNLKTLLDRNDDKENVNIENKVVKSK